jgi:tRNA A37 threonylcarbamoyladenosine dehydratase
MDPLFERSHILIGDNGITRLQNAHVFIAGLGGVGSFAAEALARIGIGKLTLADHDIVSASNINRQLIALNSTEGQLKTEVMAARIQDINPQCELSLITDFLTPDSVLEIITPEFDCVVDAIDSMSSKISLLEASWQQGIPTFASMGAGGKLDPTQIKTDDLMNTSMCKLAKQLRQHLRKRGVREGIQAVYSIEAPMPALPPEAVSHGRPRAVNGTVSYLPSLFGLTLAGMVSQHIIGDTRRIPHDG